MTFQLEKIQLVFYQLVIRQLVISSLTGHQPDFGSELFDRIELCSMLKPKRPDGSYHVEHEGEILTLRSTSRDYKIK